MAFGWLPGCQQFKCGEGCCYHSETYIGSIYVYWENMSRIFSLLCNFSNFLIPNLFFILKSWSLIKTCIHIRPFINQHKYNIVFLVNNIVYYQFWIIFNILSRYYISKMITFLEISRIKFIYSLSMKKHAKRHTVPWTKQKSQKTETYRWKCRGT